MKETIKLLTLTVAAGLVISGVSLADTATTPVKPALEQISYTNSLDMVASPTRYLNKYVTIKGKFDKFSTLGLDYAPAMRSSEDYITFLIQRPDITDHNIPLSELKIFIKRSVAEKYIELNAGDEIEFGGKVFSTALGDVWMDAETFKVLSKQPEK